MRRSSAAYQSLSAPTKRPVSPSFTCSAKAPTRLATVGTLTRPASSHLFSDFARLKIVSTSGARIISQSTITLGSSRQSTKPDVITRSLYGSSAAGTSRIPAILRWSCGYASNSRIKSGMTSSKSSLCVILPLKYPMMILSASLAIFPSARSSSAILDVLIISSEAALRLISTSPVVYFCSSSRSCVVVVTT